MRTRGSAPTVEVSHEVLQPDIPLFIHPPAPQRTPGGCNAKFDHERRTYNDFPRGHPLESSKKCVAGIPARIFDSQTSVQYHKHSQIKDAPPQPPGTHSCFLWRALQSNWQRLIDVDSNTTPPKSTLRFAKTVFLLPRFVKRLPLVLKNFPRAPKSATPRPKG